MGFFEGLDAEKYDRQYSDRQLARRALTYFKPVAGKLALLVLFTLIVAGCGALLPIIVSRGIDQLEGAASAAPALLIAGPPPATVSTAPCMAFSGHGRADARQCNRSLAGHPSGTRRKVSLARAGVPRNMQGACLRACWP